MVAERAQQIIDQAAEERVRFIEWARGVSPGGWANTSPDGIWQARDYVAHLASIDPLLTAWFRAVQGGEYGGVGDPQFSIDDWNEEQILARRQRPLDELLDEMAAYRIELNTALVDLTDEQLDSVVHFSGDNKRAPRDIPLHLFLRAWVYHDRWHMEDARRAIAGEPEQPFGDEAFAQAMRGRAQSQAP